MNRKHDKESEKKGINLIKYYLSKKVIQIILIIIVIAAVIFGVSNYFKTESKTTKIGFEDIGELATQAAYCTEVNVTEAARDLFPRATSQADMLACPFGDCREGLIPRCLHRC